MNTMPEHQGNDPAIDPARKTGDVDALSALIIEIVRTRELRELMGSIAPEVLRVWAGSSYIKKAMAAPVGSVIEKGLKKEKELQAARALPALFDDPDFLKNMSGELPVLINGLIDTIGSIGRYIETLPVEERARYLTSLLSDIKINKTGELITTFARIVNQMYSGNPQLLTTTLMPAIRTWIEHTDFGELRETLEISNDDIMELVTQFWNALCRYPAKVVTLMSIIPNLANIIIHILTETLGQISRLFQSPDMITNFFLSVLRSIDGKAVGELVNVLSEMSRQLYTGSALLGEPGTPVFIRDISTFLTDVIYAVDGEVFNKARRGVAEGRETVHKAVMDILRNKPGMFIRYLQTSNHLRNMRIKTISRKMALVEDIPEDEMTNVLAQGLIGLNTHDMAEIVNAASRTLNRIRRLGPEFDVSLISEFVNGVDMDELREAARWIAEEMGNTIRPIGRILFPPLVKMICDWATPEKDGFDQDVREAVNALRNLLQTQEVRR